LLLLDGEFNLIAASASFFDAFQIEPASALDRSVFKIGSGEWDTPQLRSLLEAALAGDAKIDAHEMDLDRKGQEPRRLVLNAQKLAYGHESEVRLLFAVSDVTDARLSARIKDDLLRQKAILLQELQHRIANSLQIIASVLMQSARQVNSDETRRHLYDAGNRVMSVAAMQKQLATTTLNDVALRPYFTDLCHSIAASMIRNPEQLSLAVDADESVVNPDVSISLGLIVTELVINALKHAFPGGRHGRILVDYHAHGSKWTLSVADDGIGTPSNRAAAKSGLGTNIIEALAKQLNARVQFTDAHPGAKVSIVHP